MAQFADIEGLRQATNLQTELVLREVRLAEEAIRRGRAVAIVEDDQDEPMPPTSPVDAQPRSSCHFRRALDRRRG